jgi:PAS domain S-box-containing protein
MEKLNQELEQRVKGRIEQLESINAELFQSRAKLDAALACMVDAVFISDAEGRFVEFNDAFVTFHRFRNKAECAKTFSEYPDILEVFFPNGELTPVNMWAVPRALRGEIATNTEYSLRRKDTGESWVGSYSFGPIRDNDGCIIGSIVIGRDITSQKIADEKMKHLAAIVYASEDAIIGKNLDGIITSWNKGAEKIYGYTENEVIGKPISILIPDGKENEVPELLAKVRSGEYINHYETVRKRKNGKEIFMSLTISPILDADGRIIAASTIGRNITRRKKAEENLVKLNQNLEQRVKERTAEIFLSSQRLQTSNQLLQSANQELEAFSYSVSHDLRAPLRHISGYVDLLNKRFHDFLPEKGKHYLDSIADSAHQMGTLIDDLLQFSRTGRQEMKLVDFDINIILNEALDQIKPDDSPDIQWVIPKLPNVFGDPSLIRLVWINLLNNAVKFTRTRKKPVIEIESHLVNEEIVFLVRDNGVGFDMKYAQKLFGVFQRLHSTNEFEGTGIGLATVRRIIFKHQGRTWAEAEPDKGAVFYFTLPNHKERIS